MQTAADVAHTEQRQSTRRQSDRDLLLELDSMRERCDSLHKGMDALVAQAFKAGAAAGVMEAHKLLAIFREHKSSDRILTHWDSILNRATAHEMTSAAIAKAKREE